MNTNGFFSQQTQKKWVDLFTKKLNQSQPHDRKIVLDTFLAASAQRYAEKHENEIESSYEKPSSYYYDVVPTRDHDPRTGKEILEDFLKHESQDDIDFFFDSLHYCRPIEMVISHRKRKVHKKYSRRTNLLHLVCLIGDLDLVWRLLQKGFLGRDQSKCGVLPIHCLLSSGLEFETITPPSNMSPVPSLSLTPDGNWEAFFSLLLKGVDLEMVKERCDCHQLIGGNTLLHSAIEFKWPSFAKWLLEAGGVKLVQIRNFEGKFPVDGVSPMDEKFSELLLLTINMKQNANTKESQKRNKVLKNKSRLARFQSDPNTNSKADFFDPNCNLFSNEEEDDLASTTQSGPALQIVQKRSSLVSRSIPVADPSPKRSPNLFSSQSFSPPTHMLKSSGFSDPAVHFTPFTTPSPPDLKQSFEKQILHKICSIGNSPRRKISWFLMGFEQFGVDKVTFFKELTNLLKSMLSSPIETEKSELSKSSPSLPFSEPVEAPKNYRSPPFSSQSIKRTRKSSVSYSPKVGRNSPLPNLHVSKQRQRQPSLTSLPSPSGVVKKEVSPNKTFFSHLLKIPPSSHEEEGGVSILWHVLHEWMALTGGGYAKSDKSFHRSVVQFLSDTTQPEANNIKLSLLRQKANQTDDAERIILSLKKVIKTPFVRMEENWFLQKYSPQDIANAITLVISHVFHFLQPNEMHDVFQGSEREQKSPHIHLLGLIFNKISSVFVQEILNSSEYGGCLDSVEKSIEVASLLKKMNNFEGCSAVMSALDAASIRRLKPVWDEVKPKLLKTRKKVQLSLDHHAYWDSFRSSKPPLIPYFAPKLRDLRYLYDSLKFDSEELQFEEKWNNIMKVGKSIEEYLQYRSFEYSFETPPHQLVQLFRGGEDSSGLVFDFDSFEDMMYEQSLSVFRHKK